MQSSEEPAHQSTCKIYCILTAHHNTSPQPQVYVMWGQRNYHRLFGIFKSILTCKRLISKEVCNISEIILSSISRRTPSFIYYTPPCLIKLLFKSEVPHLNIGATLGVKGCQVPACTGTNTHSESLWSCKSIATHIYCNKGFAHMNCADMSLVNVRKSWFCRNVRRLAAQ